MRGLGVDSITDGRTDEGKYNIPFTFSKKNMGIINHLLYGLNFVEICYGIREIANFHYSVDFIFLSFGIMGFIVEL